VTCDQLVMRNLLLGVGLGLVFAKPLRTAWDRMVAGLRWIRRGPAPQKADLTRTTGASDRLKRLLERALLGLCLAVVAVGAVVSIGLVVTALFS
jgi:hypothetical protein